MDELERITHIKFAFSVDFMGFPVDIEFYEENEWIELLKDETLDPIGVHGPYGVLAPDVKRMVNEKYLIQTCPRVLCAPVRYHDDFALTEWSKYWIAHLAAHFSTIHTALSLGEGFLPDAELERRVEQSVSEQYPILANIGEEVKGFHEHQPRGTV